MQSSQSIKKLLELWDDGYPVRVIAEITGVKRDAIKKHFKKLGIDTSKNAWNRRWTLRKEWDSEQLLKLWKEGWTVTAIAKHLNRDRHCVSKIMTKLGIDTTERRSIGLIRWNKSDKGKEIASRNGKEWGPVNIRTHLLAHINADQGALYAILSLAFPDEVEYEFNPEGTRYFLDLAIPNRKLAIEIDEFHHMKDKVFEYDVKRQRDIEAMGWTFVRLERNAVVSNLWGCINAIFNQMGLRVEISTRTLPCNIVNKIVAGDDIVQSSVKTESEDKELHEKVA